ncbi:MAG: energy-coupled thiamine transporter ThiT, partial [Firmicutes bacterium]|nr:energy-coupled thiamine transporter ThiT [Bacillota bacterium]
VTYSLTYNGSYMLVETIISVVVIALLYKSAPKLFKAV